MLSDTTLDPPPQGVEGIWWVGTICVINTVWSRANTETSQLIVYVYAVFVLIVPLHRVQKV